MRAPVWTLAVLLTGCCSTPGGVVAERPAPRPAAATPRPAAPRAARRAPALPVEPRLSLDLHERPLPEVLELIARRGGRTLVCDPRAKDICVTLSLREVPWSAALCLVLQRADCEYVGFGEDVRYVTHRSRVTMP